MKANTIASAMLCRQPRFLGGRLILSGYDGVWNAVDDIPPHLQPYLTNDVGKGEGNYGGLVQITSRKLFNLLPELGLFACFRSVDKALVDELNVRPPTEFYCEIESELQLVGWDIFTGNGWRSASTDGCFPLDPFTGEILGDHVPNEFGLIRTEIECTDLCAMNNKMVPSWAPWNPVAVYLDRTSYERLSVVVNGQDATR
jgi:hypothetical protein